MSSRFPGAALLLCLAGCGSLPVVNTPADNSRPVDVKLIAFNDFHGNLKTPSLRIPVPDASQSVGFRFEPAGGVEVVLVQQAAEREDQHRGGPSASCLGLGASLVGGQIEHHQDGERAFARAEAVHESRVDISSVPVAELG